LNKIKKKEVALDIKKEKWEESYKRKENFIFYPHEECIKFLNRFVRKKISADGKFIDIMNSQNELTALDFGCGIGRISVLLNEFDIKSYGIDVSEIAIQEAKILSEQLGYGKDTNFQSYDGHNIPFENGFFDFTISDCVIDSVSFELAKKLVKEIDRVTKKYFYLSVISSSSKALFTSIESVADEIVVEETHEKGTVQSFYDIEKINKLIEGTNFKIKWGQLSTYQDIINSQYTHGRYNIVLEK
jgi:ubiquinone/menaquinone biosynthesis C-methylase UbiE